MQWFADEQGKSDVAAMIAVQKLAETINTTDYLARITAPVLTIYPSEGPITTPEQEALLHRHLSNLKLVHLPSRYHNLHITQAAACAEHVLNFAAQFEGMACREA
jgi:pimeloyl-ACP methyl ester carboxylesterase